MAKVAQEKRYYSRSDSFTLDSAGKGFKGVAAVYNQPSLILMRGTGFEFTEIFLPGCFAKRGDVVALYDHESCLPLGRESSGQLTLTDTETELQFTLDPVDTAAGRDVRTLVSSGVLKGCSVGFNILDMDFDESKSLATVKSAELIEITLTVFPAYPQTSVTSVRSFRKNKLSNRKQQIDLLALRKPKGF